MGGPNATNSVEEASAAVYQVISEISAADTGKFLNYDGSTMAW
jgi:hypothetical protein